MLFLSTPRSVFDSGIEVVMVSLTALFSASTLNVELFCHDSRNLGPAWDFPFFYEQTKDSVLLK